MPEGDSTIHYTGAGLISVGVDKSVEANTAQKITTTLGINFSSDNDFSVEVPMKGGGSRKIMPESVAELESAAKKMLANDTRAVLDDMLNDRKPSFKVKEGGKQVGEIDPQALLDAIAAARAAGQIK